MSDESLLCKDCKHSRISPIAIVGSYIFEFSKPDPVYYKCGRTFTPKRFEVNFVTGSTKIPSSMSYCENERKIGSCGRRAKYWQPKKKKDLFKLLTREENV